MAGIDSVGEDPGLQSVARATAQPASTSERAGAHGDRRKNEVPGRSTAAVFDPASAAMPSLVRMEVDAPAVVVRVGEESSRLLEVEDTLLAEHVHRLGKTQAGNLGMNLVDQPAHPDFRVVTVLRWDLVRRQAGRVEVDRVLAAGLADDLQHAHLGLEVEPIAGLGLDGGRAVEQEAVETFDG
jgi:hypothetical protein